MFSIFSLPTDPSLFSYGTYDPRLVALSVLVAIFSSYMGLQMAGQAAGTRAQRAVVLCTGSLALGAGVWAMHFIGMLAFNLCTRVDYDPTITILSNLPSICASFVALSLIGRERLGGWSLVAGGVLVGAGIGAMHYAGMSGMRMSLALRYDPAVFALSIVVDPLRPVRIAWFVRTAAPADRGGGDGLCDRRHALHGNGSGALRRPPRQRRRHHQQLVRGAGHHRHHGRVHRVRTGRQRHAALPPAVP
jgi:hypothetical protein